MARGVREEVAEHLHDAPLVGHHRRQVRGQVDAHRLAGAGALERAPRPLDQRRHLPGLGLDGELARVDAPRVEQVGDEVVHAVRLLVDDAVERAKLRPVERARGAKQRRRHALDGDERRAQLVAHHGEELGAQALGLLQRREVLHRDHHRLGLAPAGADGGRVDEHAHAPPVGDGELDLGGAKALGALELLQRDLAPVGEARGQHLAQALQRPVGGEQPREDALRLAVDGERIAASRVEHHHPDRRGLDERFQVGPRAALVAVRARIGDGDGGLGCEQHQHLLVLVGELFPARLLAEEEVPDVEAAVAHRRALEGAAGDEPGRKPERGDVLAEVGEAKRPVEATQMREQAHRVGPGRHLPRLLGGEARDDVPLRHARLVDGGDDAVARAGERAGALHHLAQHGVEVEARADAQHRRAQARDGRARRPGVRVAAVGFGHRLSPPVRRRGRRDAGCGAAAISTRAPPPRKNGDSGVLSSCLHDFTRNLHAHRVSLRLYSCPLVRAPRCGGMASGLPGGRAGRRAGAPRLRRRRRGDLRGCRGRELGRQGR